MELVYPRSDEKRLVHLSELVSLATQDVEDGHEVLPRQLYDRLVSTEQQFLAKYKWLGKKTAEKIEAVAARNKAHKRLTYYVLDVFVMARRKYDRGDLNAQAMSLHCIPKGTVYERGQPGIWSEHAKQLLDGDAEWTQSNPTILNDPTREMLTQANQAAKTTRGIANRALYELGKIQTEMQALRQQVTQLLAQARHCIVGAYYHLDPPKLRELLFAYGYRFRTGRKKAKDQADKAQPLTRSKTIPKDHAFTYPSTPKTESPKTTTPQAPKTTPPTTDAARLQSSQDPNQAASPPATKEETMPPKIQKSQESSQADTPTTLRATAHSQVPPTLRSLAEDLEDLPPEEDFIDKELREVMTIREKPAKRPLYQQSNHTPSTKADREKKKKQRKMTKQSRKKT